MIRNCFARALTLAYLLASMCAFVFALFSLQSALAAPHLDTDNALLQGVSAGQVVKSCLTPAVTAGNAYGTNFVVSGLLTFPNVLPPSGRGVLISASIQVKEAQTQGYTLTPLSAPTTATTWTDHTVAAIAAADALLPEGGIVFNGSSVLGTHTTAVVTGINQGLDMSANATPTSLSAILTTNGALSATYAGTPDPKVCVVVVQFP